MAISIDKAALAPFVSLDKLKTLAASARDAEARVRKIKLDHDAALASQLAAVQAAYALDARPDLSVQQRNSRIVEDTRAVRLAHREKLTAALADERKAADTLHASARAALAHYTNPVRFVQAEADPAAFAMLDRLGNVGLKNALETALSKLAAGDRTQLALIGAAIPVLEDRKGFDLTPAALAAETVRHLPEYAEAHREAITAASAASYVATVAADIERTGEVQPRTKIAAGLRALQQEEASAE
ncbi:MAG: hypothetical protein HXY28_12805 [Hydrogenophilaceae bacterium]|jgi:hypothetical protein|nr:hypothetical protein [Hydrogenophilaceae bacterium]